MPVALVALMIAGIAALAYKKKNPLAPVVVQTTPYNGGVGIVGGFAAPPVSDPSSELQPHLAQSNIPNASQSGVPTHTSNVQEFNSSPAQWSPGGIVRPPYYNQGAIEPTFSSAARQRRKSASNSGCSCGGGHANASSCASAQSRNKDGGCLAPTRAAQLQDSEGVIAAWAANIASNGVTPWDAMQQNQFDVQQNLSTEENKNPPTAPQLTGIGLNYRRPHRSVIAN